MWLRRGLKQGFVSRPSRQGYSDASGQPVFGKPKKFNIWNTIIKRIMKYESASWIYLWKLLIFKVKLSSTLGRLVPRKAFKQDFSSFIFVPNIVIFNIYLHLLISLVHLCYEEWIKRNVLYLYCLFRYYLDEAGVFFKQRIRKHSMKMK